MEQPREVLVGNKLIPVVSPRGPVKEIVSRGRVPFSGHRFIVGDRNRLCGEKRCIYCGRWFTWQDKEPSHCGKMACEDFHWRRIRHEQNISETSEAYKKFMENPKMVRDVLSKVRNLHHLGVMP